MSKITKICTINGCDKKARSNSCPWCEMHYYRNRRNGDPEMLYLCQYNVDEKLFDEWNDKTAWLIGLLWTDGWMNKNGNSVGLKLSYTVSSTGINAFGEESSGLTLVS